MKYQTRKHPATNTVDPTPTRNHAQLGIDDQLRLQDGLLLQAGPTNWLVLPSMDALLPHLIAFGAVVGAQDERLEAGRTDRVEAPTCWPHGSPQSFRVCPPTINHGEGVWGWGKVPGRTPRRLQTTGKEIWSW